MFTETLFSTVGGVGAKDVWDAGDLHLMTSSATDVCLHLQHSLQRSMGMSDLDQNVGFSSLPGLCAGVTTMPCHSLCLDAGWHTCVVLQDLGVSQVTLDLGFLIFSVHVLILRCQEHSHFKAFLHNVYIVEFCVFGWGFLDMLSVLAALKSGDLLRGTPVLNSV